MDKHKILLIRDIREKKNLKIFRGVISKLQGDKEFVRLISDHLSGMTDTFAQREYERLFEPLVAYVE